jgi:hypothetical protein
MLLRASRTNFFLGRIPFISTAPKRSKSFTNLWNSERAKSGEGDHAEKAPLKPIDYGKLPRTWPQTKPPDEFLFLKPKRKKVDFGNTVPNHVYFQVPSTVCSCGINALYNFFSNGI